MPIKVEQIDSANTFVLTYVHWVPSSSNVIKVVVEIDWNIKTLFEMRNVNWIDRVLYIIQALFVETL